MSTIGSLTGSSNTSIVTEASMIVFSTTTIGVGGTVRQSAARGASIASVSPKSKVGTVALGRGFGIGRGMVSSNIIGSSSGRNGQADSAT